MKVERKKKKYCITHKHTSHTRNTVTNTVVGIEARCLSCYNQSEILPWSTTETLRIGGETDEIMVRIKTTSKGHWLFFFCTKASMVQLLITSLKSHHQHLVNLVTLQQQWVEHLSSRLVLALALQVQLQLFSLLLESQALALHLFFSLRLCSADQL